MRSILRVPLAALLAFATLYAGDYLCARDHTPGTVQVQTLYETAQKNGRVESWVGDTGPETCVRSLFPHLGYAPCWYLTRHPRKTIVIG